MSATIIQFVPRGRLGRIGDYYADYCGPQEPNGTPVDREKLIEQARNNYEAIFPTEIANVALIGTPHDTAIYESSLGFVPPEDCA